MTLLYVSQNYDVDGGLKLNFEDCVPNSGLKGCMTTWNLMVGILNPVTRV